MVKKYLTYINEAKKSKPKFFNVGELLNKNDNITISEKEIEDLVIGEICVWYTKSQFKDSKPNITKQVVSDVEVRNNRGVFFNGFTVDIDKNVEIEGGHKVIEIEDASYVNLHDIVGFPTGEVLYVTRSEMQNLLDKGLVRYEKWMNWRDKDYKDIYFFKDIDYHKIKIEIDPNYKKSSGGITGTKDKKKNNIDEQDDYNIGDVIVCQGMAGRLDVGERIAKILDKVKKPKEDQYDYVVAFMMNFSHYLMDKNTWWIKDENIKGLYTGDIKTQLYLAGLQQYNDDDLEEHELDDNYHIRQAFKKIPEPIDRPQNNGPAYLKYLNNLKAEGKIDDKKYQQMLNTIPDYKEKKPENIKEWMKDYLDDDEINKRKNG